MWSILNLQKLLHPIIVRCNLDITRKCVYRKVASIRLSRLIAHPSILRLFMKGKFDAYELCTLGFFELRLFKPLLNRPQAQGCQGRQKDLKDLRITTICPSF